MKKSSIFLIFGVFCMLASGCAGLHQHVTSNLNSNVTNVVLSGNNYKIVQKVSASAASKKSTIKDMVVKVREDMLKNVEMVGLPRAIINESIEIHYTKGFMGLKWYTITISAYVIEFTGGAPASSSGSSTAPGGQPLQPRW